MPKISALPAASSVTSDDYIAIVNAPATVPVTQYATLAQLRTSILGGGSGYTATDPITAGAASFTTLAASGDITRTGTRPVFVAGNDTRPARFGQVTNNRFDLSQNVWFDGLSWNLDDITFAGHLLRSTAANPLTISTFSAGANPRTEDVLWRIDVNGATTQVGKSSLYEATAVPATAGAAAAGAPIVLYSGLLTIEATSNVPTHARPKGSLCINTGGSSTTTRLYVNTDGAGTWTPFTTSA